jgi:Smg protein
MKESILDVLLYLFEHYFTNEALAVPGDDFPPQAGPLVGELTAAGFPAP